jgi:hypothetical protein
MHTVLGSFGGALGVASNVGGTTGALLARAARAGFMSGVEVSFLVGAAVSLAAVVIVFVWLPSRPLPVPPDPSVEPLLLLDHSALTDVDSRSVIALERRDDNDAPGPRGEGNMTTTAVSPEGTPNPLESGTRQFVPVDG